MAGAGVSFPKFTDYASYERIGAEAQRAPVAIVTVVLDAVSTLPATFASVHAQSLAVRHVIVDGGSTDGSLDYIHANRRAGDIIISEPDRGISDAMNKGVAASNSDYVLMLHGDDSLGPTQLRTALAAARAGDLDAVFGSARMLRDGRFWFLWRGDPDYASKLKRRMPAVPHPSLLISRRAFERAGLYSLDYRLAMDFEWLVRAEQAGVKATFVEGVIADMNHDGRSNTLFSQTLAEVASVVHAYGRSWPLAQAERYARLMKTHVSRRAQRHAPWLHARLQTAVNRQVSFDPSS